MIAVAAKTPTTYKLVEYMGGAINGELITDDFEQAQQFYWRGDLETASVRVYTNGKRLSYLESDRLFGRLGWYGKSQRKDNRK